jgi:transcriptional regulator with PAS, ATPase and Fis domain
LFRDDFFYRLSSDVIHVPPLRQRLLEAPGELRQLLDHAIANLVGEATAELAEPVEAAILRTVGERYSWPGNVRELEQAVRRILLTGTYAGSAPPKGKDLVERLVTGIEAETLDADALLAGYCALIYENTGNYEAVARQTNLDRRTAKKYVQQGRSNPRF